MGISQKAKEELEKARYEVADDEVVVHGAEITCKFGSGSKKQNYLLVLDGHGLMTDGSHCAHDGNCVPIKNIKPFEHCTTSNAKAVLTTLASTASGDLKIRCDAALKVIKANENASASDGVVSLVPCSLPLLDRWFDADEKEIVTDSFAIGAKIVSDIKSLKTLMLDSLETGRAYNSAIYFNGYYGDTKYTVAERAKFKKKGEDLEAQKKTIEKLYTKLRDSINTKMLNNANKFNYIVDELNEAKEIIESIRLIWMASYVMYLSLDSYGDHLNSLNDIIAYIDEQIKDINEWGEKQYHLLTTKSFLVCRCGGIITIKDSGQKFEDQKDALVKSILDMIYQFKEHSLVKMEDYRPIDVNEADDVWTSLNAAVVGLGYFENLLLGNGGETTQTDVCIYIELICHSYNDEMKKAMMSFLSLLSMNSGILSCGLAIYSVVTMEDGLEGAVDGFLAEADVLESLKEDGDGILTRLGAGAIAKSASVYSIVTNIINLFYVSYETWIENIKLTVFTETHAHVSKRKLNTVGELVAGEDIKMYSEFEFKTDQKGDGLKWKEEPGVYMRRLAHKGDQMSSVGVILDKSEDIRNGANE